MGRAAGRTKAAKPWSKTKLKRRDLSPDVEWALAIRDRILASCHPFQRDAVEDPARFFTWLVGRGGGKTTAFKAKLLIGLTSVYRGRFVYIAPTLGMATELLWDPLKDTVAQLEGLGLLAPGDFEFKEIGKRVTCRRTGATLRLVGADDNRELDKLRGQPFDGVAVDEAALFPPDMQERLAERIIIPRLGERNGWLGFASTPGHVLRGLFYEASRLGSKIHRPYSDRHKPEYANWRRWSSHAWSLKSVAELPDAEKLYPAIVANWRDALQKKADENISDDNPIWKRERLGLWAQDDTDMVFKYRPHDAAGAPFNQWDPAPGLTELAQLKEAIRKLPKDVGPWHFVVPGDMGTADPFALNVFAFAPADPRRRIFHVMAYERVGMYAKPIAELLLGEQLSLDTPAGIFGVIGWPDGLVLDADLALIEELANVYGVRFLKAERKIDYKFGAIELVNGDFYDGRIFIIKGSPLEQQLLQLQWTTDDFSGRQREHKAQANHSTDTLIYGRRIIAHLFEVGVAVPPPAEEEAPKKRDPVETGEIPGRVAGEFGAFLSDGDYVDDQWDNSSGWGNNDNHGF